ncbi:MULTISPECIES: Scr1 family TA system antitoxin-like transcriptional regulator [unclassified Streptomyces]|uniref:Scr1 family TA system antitoxin-like transcriptional regulator n=1 Tax=unclassified Streptomyces TaxID=2593676 RepID=UPI00237B2065|nr:MULTISPECIES: Scr1 family TA system antitoxin-like transcriptional regulator [unclassified Streptomyces]
MAQRRSESCRSTARCDWSRYRSPRHGALSAQVSGRAPELSCVQEESSLRRPVGGVTVWRRQLENLLRLGESPFVDIQVMPTSRWVHPGTGGRIQVLKFADGTAIGRADDEFVGRPTAQPEQLRILKLRFGIIRARALTPEESLAFVKQVRRET